MARMVIVAPDKVVWRETFSASFTTAVRVENMPTAYGFLRLEEGRWGLRVVSNGELLYGGDDMRRNELAELLKTLSLDIIVLMETSDCELFQSEVAHTVNDLVVEVPQCRYSSVQS